MRQVFISYKREDAAFVQTLEQKLKEADIDSWTDAQIQAGEDWRNAIDEHIAEAFALIVVMTPDAQKSEYVTYEWSFAMGLGIPIVPINLRESDPPSKQHPKLEILHFINCTTPYREPWHEIITRIQTIYAESLVSPRMKLAIKALDHLYVDERLRGLWVLIKNNYHQAVPRIESVAKFDEEEQVRALAIRALASFQSQSSIPLLIEILTTSNNKWLQAECVSALTILNAKIAAIPMLEILEQELNQQLQTEIREDAKSNRTLSFGSLGQIGYEATDFPVTSRTNIKLHLPPIPSLTELNQPKEDMLVGAICESLVHLVDVDRDSTRLWQIFHNYVAIAIIPENRRLLDLSRPQPKGEYIRLFVELIGKLGLQNCVDLLQSLIEASIGETFSPLVHVPTALVALKRIQTPDSQAAYLALSQRLEELGKRSKKRKL
jgi:hypothetical protein